MSRRLTPCTIVPPDLYVIRDADKQLRNVLRDMGRPGYVLVARQMGKTNLLLNAKRELEDSDNAVIYVDLSTSFETERECFRQIIDTAVETRPDVFEKCKATIYQARVQSPPPSYKEHENELRTLLGAITGKLVIILDEIDSLTKGTFSDRVFAQIRSVYFNRTNYPQFGRLTYVLSGVAEPSEIIKDKRISPFNIGEKIYLDDFTTEQFLDFLSRAGLALTKESTDRIQHWANGNPRLTWDICFDIEEKRATGTTITPEEVDETVRKLYLTDFARAPVDHIREVVTADDELRNAITVIAYGKGNTLPDTTKNKLYLAGIIRSAANHGNIAIKNRIISAALSDQWLRDISLQKKGLAKLAAEHYNEHRYDQALLLYEQMIQSPDTSAKEKDSSYWNMGLCAYHVGQYQKALEYLEKTHWDKAATAVLYYDRVYYIGACYLQTGNIEASRSKFQETLETPTKNRTYFGALVNIAATYSAENKFARAIELYVKAITDIDDSALPTEDSTKLKTSALFNLAKVYSDTGNKAKALVHFQKALEVSNPNQRPAIMLAMCKWLTKREEKKRLLTECVDLIANNNLRPDASQSEGTLGLTITVVYALLREMYIFDRALFNRLFRFACTLQELDRSSAKILLYLAYLSVANGDLVSTVTLAREVVERALSGSVSDKATEFESYRLLSLFCRTRERHTYQLKYVGCLKSGFTPQRIDSADIKIFTDLASELVKSNEFVGAIDNINLAKQYKPLVVRDELPGFAALNYYEMMAYRGAQSWGKLKESAQETLAFLKSLDKCANAFRLVNEEGLKQIEECARNNLVPGADVFDSTTAAPPKVRSAVRSTRKYGRNERVSVRYHNGTVVNDVKFKNVENDLEGGHCVVVEGQSVMGSK